MTVLDALLDARLAEAYAENLHPRGPGGKWIPKVGDRASYFHSMLGRSFDVRVHSSPDARGFMRIRMPQGEPFNGEVRRVKAMTVSHPHTGVSVQGVNPEELNRHHTTIRGLSAKLDSARQTGKPSASIETHLRSALDKYESGGGAETEHTRRARGILTKPALVPSASVRPGGTTLRGGPLPGQRADEALASQVEDIQREYRTAGDAVIAARKTGDPKVIAKAEQRWTKAKDRLRNVTAEQRAAYGRARPNAFK